MTPIEDLERFTLAMVPTWCVGNIDAGIAKLTVEPHYDWQRTRRTLMDALAKRKT